MLAPGDQILGRYRLTRVLAQGGMGIVWAAKNEAIERDVAIKVMLPELADDKESFERFLKEARICGSIRHPGIVDVLDLGKAEDGSPFIVMELLDGRNLEAVMPRLKKLGPGAILCIVRDAARAIALAHAKGIVHRDIKPANLFLHRPPVGGLVVKVLDFGVSKIVSPTSATKSTRTGTFLGSPAYMSPEQADGRIQVDQRADIFALGLILYEVIAGRLPFDADSYNALVVDLATKDVPPIGTWAPYVPKRLADLVHACLERDRNRRLQSASELADRIDALLRELGQSSAFVGSLLDPDDGQPAGGVPTAGAVAAHSGRDPFASSAYSPTVIGETTSGAPALRRRRLSRVAMGMAALGATGVVAALLLFPSRRGATELSAASAAADTPRDASTPEPEAPVATVSVSALASPPTTSASAEAPSASLQPAARPPAVPPRSKSARPAAEPPEAQPRGKDAWGYD